LGTCGLASPRRFVVILSLPARTIPQPAQAGFAPVDAVSNRRMNPPDTLAIGNRADTIQVRRRGLPQPAQAGFVPVDAVSNRRMNPPDETAGCNPPDESKNIPPTAYLHPTRNIDY
jgi:hypothetical protein